ncbi:MAG: glycine dehydrogenase [Actinomycetota bacterium]|nr:glycine dehydrogenase [Actinomycetota bacterium]
MTDPTTSAPAGRSELDATVTFARRHIGPAVEDQAKMLALLGHASLEDLVAAATPASIRADRPLAIEAGRAEHEVLEELRGLASRNQVVTSMIGLGYHGTVTPPVILRNVLESPAWYTAYTPYQPEISQGRLEALLNFQTVVADLTGLPLSGASLLDEATAAAEAMTLARRISTAPAAAVFVIDAAVLPQTRAVVETRAEPLGLRLVVADVVRDGLPEDEVFGVLLQYPGATGEVCDLSAICEAAHERGALVTVAADLLALTLLRPPGEMGADIAVGSTQRFGVPMGFGGPHAGYLAVRQGLERSLPGRLVGVSRDADGAPAYRLALQTREQHIRREKATNNICTAQALNALGAMVHLAWLGREGFRELGELLVRRTAYARERLAAVEGVELLHDAPVVREFAVKLDAPVGAVLDRVAERGIAAGYPLGREYPEYEDGLLIAITERRTPEQIDALADALGAAVAAERQGVAA